MLYQLMYSSVATDEFTEEGLVELLDVSRIANEPHGITGLLIYFAPTHEFFQVLEGEQAEVERLMRNIENDKRHWQVSIEIEGPIKARSFGTWHMGFLRREHPKPETLAGFADVLHEGLASADLTGEKTPALVLVQTTQTMLSAQIGAATENALT